MELACVRALHTWCNNWVPPRTMFKRLDRVFVNKAWKSKYQSAFLECIPTLASDHKFLCLMEHLDPERLHRPFRFEAMWLCNLIVKK